MTASTSSQPALETEAISTLTMLQSAYKSALEGMFFRPYNGAPENTL